MENKFEELPSISSEKLPLSSPCAFDPQLDPLLEIEEKPKVESLLNPKTRDETDGNAIGLATIALTEILKEIEPKSPTSKKPSAELDTAEESSSPQSKIRMYVTIVFKWIKILIWVIILVLVLRGVLFGSSSSQQNPIDELNSLSSLQNDKKSDMELNGQDFLRENQRTGSKANTEKVSKSETLLDPEKLMNILEALKKFDPVILQGVNAMDLGGNNSYLARQAKYKKSGSSFPRVLKNISLN